VCCIFLRGHALKFWKIFYGKRWGGGGRCECVYGTKGAVDQKRLGTTVVDYWQLVIQGQGTGLQCKSFRFQDLTDSIHFLSLASNKSKRLCMGGITPCYFYQSVIIVTVIIISHHQEHNGNSTHLMFPQKMWIPTTVSTRSHTIWQQYCRLELT
jgi:hypothetical protein